MNNKVDFLPINIAIVTISDTRDLDNDKSCLVHDIYTADRRKNEYADL